MATKEMDSIEAQIEKLRAPELAEQKRKAQIAELESRRQAILDAKAAQDKEERIQLLLAEWEENKNNWTSFVTRFKEELEVMFAEFLLHRQFSANANNIAGLINEADPKRTPPHVTLGQADMSDFIRDLLYPMDPEPGSIDERLQQMRRNPDRNWISEK